MELYVITVNKIKRDSSKLFKITVSEKEKTYRVEDTPYILGRIQLKKSEEYKPLGYDDGMMYGADKEKLLREWESLSEQRENKETARHIREMETVRARLNIVEEM